MTDASERLVETIRSVSLQGTNHVAICVHGDGDRRVS